MNTYKKAKEVIDEMYGDDTWSKDECLENLADLKDEIDILIDALGGE